MARPRDYVPRPLIWKMNLPSLRDDRYIERDNRTYVIEPRERTILEEID